jgi:catechol 2,3-dioxygenase-like lactoylglutathione lyase family enzyme
VPGVGFHHLAVATRDLGASHRFYAEAMGFELVRVEVIPYGRDGWARHLFYDTGNGEMLALWDIHDEHLGDFETGLSTGLGLPSFVNHVAFAAGGPEALDAQRDRWLAAGHDVVRIDHGWCTSVYADDPSGTTVELCLTTVPVTDDDRRLAQELLVATAPEVDGTPPAVEFFLAADYEPPAA